MEFETLLFERRGAVAVVTLNRPDAANALNPAMTAELAAAAVACDADDAVRAVVLTGTGDKLFCGGGDLQSFAEAGDGARAMVLEMTKNLHSAASRFARLDAPVLVALNGTAGGGGMSLALAGDLLFAAEGAKLTMAYTRAGLSPDGSSTYFLARIVGLRRAAELALLNRVLSAQEALEWGLVNRVLPADELMPAAMETAGRLAAGPTRAFGTAKRLLLDGFAQSLDTQMEYESRGIADCLSSADGREGVRAFLDKRKPVFRGR